MNVQRISSFEPLEGTGRCRWCLVPLDDHGPMCTRGCAVDRGGGDAAAEKRGSTPRYLHHLDLLVMSASVGTIIGALTSIVYTLIAGR